MSRGVCPVRKDGTTLSMLVPGTKQAQDASQVHAPTAPATLVSEVRL